MANVLTYCTFLLLLYAITVVGSKDIVDEFLSHNPNFPEVGIYRASDFAEPQRYGNHKYIKTFEGELTYLGLLCTFRKPIRWVYEHHEKHIPEYSMQTRFVHTKNFSDENLYLYESSLEMLFSEPLKHDVYLACVTYEDSSLMTFVSGKEVEKQGFTEFVVWNNTFEKGNVNNSRVLNKLIPPQSTENLNRNCPLKFVHYDTNTENRIYFKWIGSDYENPWSVVDATTLENSHRNVPQIEEKCRKKLGAYGNDTSLYLKPRVYQANVFHAENINANEGRVAKGVYSVFKQENKTRNFYFLWENIPMEEMFYIEEIPYEIEDETILNITTRVSQYFFSAGTVVSVSSSNDEPTYWNAEQIEPKSNDPEQGTRISRVSLPMIKSTSREQTITFYFPLVNTSGWVTAKKNIIFKGPDPKIIWILSAVFGFIAVIFFVLATILIARKIRNRKYENY